jgi:hypothetical protein
LTYLEHAKESCRHFTGLQNTFCKQGIKYDDVLQAERTFVEGRWPCLTSDISHVCPYFEEHTAEDLQRIEDAVKEALESIVDFQLRRTEACPQCGKYVESVEKIRRCIYARPCGCRLWQGTIPEAWQ